jgi:putative transposase
MNYRRILVPGGTFFFTLVTYQRQPIFSHDENVTILRECFRYVIRKHPFRIVASVILPDHLHMIGHYPMGIVITQLAGG